MTAGGGLTTENDENEEGEAGEVWGSPILALDDDNEESVSDITGV